ncbi:MAG TPA: sulfite exporter TauE/SafE family protein [Thermoleophilaceae bacterium]|nr:sulfite exporter TauE/SafE family protein [Thermoleophilaceae bacterium]
MALAALAALAGAFVQSATGFGFALVLSPALLAVLEPVEAVTTLLSLGLVLNLLVLFEHGRPEHVDWRPLVPVLLAAVPGLAVGLIALTQLSKEALQVTVGVAVILAAAWQLLRGSRPARLPAGSGWLVGFLSGALTTSISVSGPPVVIWLEARGISPEEFRASLAVSFFAFNLAGASLLVAAEGVGALDAATILPLLVLVLAGHVLGALAFRRLDRERFFTAVLVLVAATGLASIVAGLAG